MGTHADTSPFSLACFGETVAALSGPCRLRLAVYECHLQRRNYHAAAYCPILADTDLRSLLEHDGDRHTVTGGERDTAVPVSACLHLAPQRSAPPAPVHMAALVALGDAGLLLLSLLP